ncbi:efflux RND transporter permease subunit [Wukongibacter baidiensis]|uniref:efflux RND transporter permease subunit n=1 Tax=Wukongibacter baidiensis TaxID=1723361 RepID=UPI003D7F7F57
MSDNKKDHMLDLMEIPEVKQEKNFLGRWAAFFIERHRVVYLMIFLIIIWGFIAYTKMPREVNPEVRLPYGYVITTYTGAAPEEVESLITDKIEKEMETIEDVKSIESNSGYGYSTVFLEFEPGVDLDKKLQKMREGVQSIQSELPDAAETPTVDSFETNDGPIMIINLSGDYDFIELKNISEKIKNGLENIKDVSDVEIIGGLEREIKINVDPQKLASYNISLDQIKNAISMSNVNLPGGNIVLDKKDYNIRTVGKFKGIEEIEKVVVTYFGSNPLYLKDIAEIEDGYKEPENYSRMSVGLGTENPSVKNAIALSVKKNQSKDVIKISKEIHKFLEDKKGSIYPQDLKVEISGDLSVYVEDELGAVFDNAKAGLFLVIIVLFLFIGFFESIVVAIAIPLSIFIACGLMNTFDMTFNTISLFSLVLAVGMLVDNGIVVMENIDRLRLKGLSARLAAEAGTNQIAPAIAASTLTTLAAFFPISLTPGIMGDFIRPIPITVIFALTSSFFIATTVTPALSSRLLKKHKGGESLKRHPAMEKAIKIICILLVFVLAMFAFMDNNETGISFGPLSWIFAIVFSIGMAMKIFKKNTSEKEHPIIQRYGEILYSIIISRRKKLIVLGVILIAFIGSIALIPLGILKVEMFPKQDFTRLNINIKAPKGTDLDTTAVIANEVEKRLFEYSEIESFVTNIGFVGADSLESFSISVGGTPNRARIIIDLVEKEYRDRSSMEIADDLRKRIENIPGAEIKVSEIQNGPPTGSPVYIRVEGENLDELKALGKEFTEILKKIEGTRDVRNTLEAGVPELQISIDKDKAAALGLNDMTVAMGIRNAIHGYKVTTFKDDQDEVDVVIRTTSEKLKSIRDLEKLYFNSRFGKPIPFSQVASIYETKSFNVIEHHNTKRYVAVVSDIEDDVVVLDIMNGFKEAIKDYPLPENVHINYGGEAEDIQESFTDMFLNMIIAAILVYIILSVQFNSLSQPFVILFSVPLALIGVSFGLVITGNNFGFIAFVGVVALVGIAVNDAIVLVDYINYLRKNGYELNEAIKETGMTRFIPVLATTITTIGGILPLTLKQSGYAAMGYSIIFGLGMATILTLVIVPILYSLVEGIKGRFRKLQFRRRGKNEETIDIVGHN